MKIIGRKMFGKNPLNSFEKSNRVFDWIFMGFMMVVVFAVMAAFMGMDGSPESWCDSPAGYNDRRCQGFYTQDRAHPDSQAWCNSPMGYNDRRCQGSFVNQHR